LRKLGISRYSCGFVALPDGRLSDKKFTRVAIYWKELGCQGAIPHVPLPATLSSHVHLALQYIEGFLLPFSVRIENGVLSCQPNFALIAENEPVLKSHLTFYAGLVMKKKKVICVSARTAGGDLSPSKRMNE